MPYLLAMIFQMSISGREKEAGKDALFSASWKQLKEINQWERSKHILILYSPQAQLCILSYLVLTTSPGGSSPCFYFVYRDSSSERLTDLHKFAELVKDEVEIQTKSYYK